MNESLSNPTNQMNEAPTQPTYQIFLLQPADVNYTTP